MLTNEWPAHARPGPWSGVAKLEERQVPYLQMLQRLRIKEQMVFYLLLFTAEIHIGSPPQPFFAEVDINWTDMFVPSSNCTLDPETARYCLPHRRYNSTLSSTYKENMTAVKLDYTGLWTQGNLSQDLLHIAGLTVENQTFEEATVWRSLYANDWAPLDSALGLARFRPQKSGSTVETKSPLQNMIHQKLLDRNIFSLKLPRTDDELGELILGGFDRRYSKSLVSLPLTNVMGGNSPTFLFYSSCGWQVGVSAMTLCAMSGNQSPLNISLDGFTAFISNSFEFISVPPKMSAQITQHLGLDDELLDLPCYQRAELPNLTLSFGTNGVLVLTPWQYMIEVKTRTRARGV